MLYTIVPNESYGHLLDGSQKFYIFKKILIQNHCLESVSIGIYSDRYFPVFGPE